MQLKDIHNQIDQIDNEIVKLLERRFDLSNKTTHLKPAIESNAREAGILSRLINQNQGLPPVIIETIYQSIFTESKKLQAQQPDFRLDDS